MEQGTEMKILYDRRENGLSYRKLAKKYGISCSQIQRMVRSKEKNREKPEKTRPEWTEVPDDVAALKEELRLARLTIELQDFMIDISSKELGIDLRKKHGTRQSK
jgi:transposase